MSSPIAFLALDAAMLELARRTLAGRHDDVRLARGLMGEAIDVARRLSADGVEVLVSRGATAAMLLEALPALSVVDMSASALDLVAAIARARERASRIAVIAFAPMSAGAIEIGRVLGVEVSVRELRHERDIELQVRAARDDGA